MSSRARLLVFSSALLLAFGGCTDSDTGGPVGGPSLPDAGTAFGDTKAPDDPDTTVKPPQGGEKLDFKLAQGDDGKPCKGVDRCALFTSFNNTRVLEVVATRNGQPAGDLEISWEITKNKNNSLSLQTKTSFTGSNGQTQNTAKTSEQEFQYEVKAFIKGSEAKPLFFDVVVTTKGQVPLIVSYTYGGARTFQAVTTYLFKHESPQKALKCAGLDPGDLPSADVAGPPKGLQQSAAFSSLPGLTEEGTQAYTIVGLGSDQSKPPVVWGCNENVTVTSTGSQNVVIPLSDLPPKWKGAYEVTTKFDIVSALPDNVEQVVDTILGFFLDPSGQLLVLVCTFGADLGVVGDLCDFIFQDPSNPCLEDACFETAGIAAKNIINNLLSDLLEDNVGGTILETGQDIAKILTELELQATFTFHAEPRADGTFDMVQEDNKPWTAEEWHSISYRWTLGLNCPPNDDNCGKHTFPISAFQGGTVTGAFSGKVEYVGNDFFLHVDKHPLNIKYGALLDYIIQKQLLPLITGDGSSGVKVDTYEEFLKTLLGGAECLTWEIDPSVDKTCCEQFAADLAGSTTSLTADIAEAACSAGIPVVSEQLSKLLTDLDVDTDEGGFTLETSVGCQCYDHDSNQSIDTWGALDKPCHWSTKLSVGDPIENDFWATEQQ